MSKITFRADDDLIDRLEGFEASKSEVMREALRTYLDDEQSSRTSSLDDEQPASASSDNVMTDTDSIDELIAERVDTIIADRLESTVPTQQPQDVNVNISLDSGNGSITEDSDEVGQTSDTQSGKDAADVSHAHEQRKTAAGERENDESQTRGACAQCGENLSGSHVYCPNCGEKASRRVFCECGDELRSDWGFCPGCGRQTPAADVLNQPRTGANRE